MVALPHVVRRRARTAIKNSAVGVVRQRHPHVVAPRVALEVARGVGRAGVGLAAGPRVQAQLGAPARPGGVVLGVFRFFVGTS